MRTWKPLSLPNWIARKEYRFSTTRGKRARFADSTAEDPAQSRFAGQCQPRSNRIDEPEHKLFARRTCGVRADPSSIESKLRPQPPRSTQKDRPVAVLGPGLRPAECLDGPHQVVSKGAREPHSQLGRPLVPARLPCESPNHVEIDMIRSQIA